ncbi:MAG: hypothetical protein V5A88_02775 [Candidatus Thermoplasmatota archaeon]
MEKSNSSKQLGTTGFTLGLVVGTPAWIVTGALFDIGAEIGLTNGVSAGIIIGSICALALIKEWFGEREYLVIPFGMGWGTLVGVAIGLLFAWSTGVSYLAAFSAGTTAGLVSGVLIGSILWVSL